MRHAMVEYRNDYYDVGLLLCDFLIMCYDLDKMYVAYYWSDYRSVFTKYMQVCDYQSVMNKPIPGNNLKYPKDKILALMHLGWYSEQIEKLEENNFVETIKILTDIDISNIINAKPDDTIVAQTKQNITNIIQNMSKEEFNRRTNKLVDRLQSHYLSKLYRWEKQVVDITKFLSQVYANNAAYQEVFREANESKHNYYDKFKAKLNEDIEKFNLQYK